MAKHTVLVKGDSRIHESHQLLTAYIVAINSKLHRLGTKENFLVTHEVD